MADGSTSYAFDKQSARSFDSDGRMRVRGCTISVSEVNPYYGREIVGWKELGLDPNKVYDLYRDPDALEAAADSFNGPLMIRHIAQTADEPRKEYQGGSVYNVRYEHPKLLADLLVSDGQAIEYIRSEMLADLSSSYRYKAVMTPGEIDGKPFDGRMAAIEGNHVALVEDGRATGAHVADSALSSPTGATNVDPNNPDATGGNAEVAKALMMLTEQMKEIHGRLDKIEGKTDENLDLEKAELAGDSERDGVDRPDKVAVANDVDGDGEDKDDGEKKEHAMDAKAVQAVVQSAVNAAVEQERKRAAAVAQAKLDTRNDLGDMHAMDDAGEIYKAALKQRGVDVSTIPAGAEKATFQAITSAVGGKRVERANDSASDGGKPRFNTSNIRSRG